MAFQRPGSVAGFVTPTVIYAGSGFGHVAGGTPGSLPKIQRDALVRTHAANWRPDNAILVLTGDLTPEQGFALAETAFGELDQARRSASRRGEGTDRLRGQERRRRPARHRPGGGHGRPSQRSCAPTRATMPAWWPTACWAAAIRPG